MPKAQAQPVAVKRKRQSPYRSVNPSAFLFGQAWVHAPWRLEAECFKPGVNTSLFYVEKGPGVDTRALVDQARKICAVCPVRFECLEFAMLDAQWWWGIWGGLTARERRKLRSRWKVLRLTIPQGIELMRKE